MIVRRLARLSDAEVIRLQALDLSYTADGAVPPGFWTYRMAGVIGHGRECFERASKQVMAHEVFLRSGIAVATSSPTAHIDSVLRLRLPVGPLGFAGFSRVVEIIETPHRRGLAYGTLPGHPISGREELRVEIDDSEVVRLSVEVFSRPRAWYAKLCQPVVRALQLRMARRFSRSLVLADR